MGYFPGKNLENFLQLVRWKAFLGNENIGMLGKLRRRWIS
jgi:hypothetical protein